MELIKVENHVELEKAEWRGLCRGTLACNVGADEVTGKAALRVQAGAGIAGEVKEMEQEAVQRPRGPTRPSQAVQRERARGAGSIPPVGRSGNLLSETVARNQCAQPGGGAGSRVIPTRWPKRPPNG